jgi:predicted ATPase/DNA-binding winged helix-turn-helix (wHTH) protein
MTRPSPRFYEFGPFLLDTRERLLVRRDGESIPLRAKVFDTLVALVENSGHALTKDELMARLWPDAFVEEGSLTQNVSRLRKVLGEGGEDYIETLPGRGYRFVAEVRELEGDDAALVVRRRTRARIITTEVTEDDAAEETPAAIPSGRASGLRLSGEMDLSELLESRPNNLAGHLTQLIGRTRELEETVELLRRGGVRLLTFTGAGGSGKTRLAAHAAARSLGEFADGAFFIDLAPVGEPRLVASAAARALGVKESGARPLEEELKEFLRARKMLLVLDNFEHLLAAAPLVSELLAAARELKIVVTSRALLRLSAEREIVVPPLALPEGGAHGASPDELLAYPAIELFAARARQAHPAFALDGGCAREVAEICSRLDGLPLAIELAAARVKLMSPRAILSRLENRLKLLTGGARDLPARQRTMRAAVEWSHDLLDEDEKTLFRRLSVFAGGITLEAVEAICADRGLVGADSDTSPPESTNIDERRAARNPQPATRDPQLEVLDALASLLDKSLLARGEGVGGEPRFRMLEVVREYALEALEASGEGEATRRSHACHFVALAERAHPELSRERVAEWLEVLEEQHDNLRAALRWLIEREPETAARLAGSMFRFWVLHGHLSEGRGWMEKVSGRAKDISPAALWRVLNGSFHLARHQGDYAAAREFCEAGLVAAKASGDKYFVAVSNRASGLLSLLLGDHAAARAFLEVSLRLARESDDEMTMMTSLHTLAELARTEGDYAEARRLNEECLPYFKRAGNREGASVTLNNLGAAAYYEGDFEDALSYYTEAAEIAQELDYKVSLALALDGLAALAAKGGRAEQAALVAGAADALRESISFELEPADRQFRELYIAESRARLDAATFDAALARGRALPPEQAVAVALSHDPAN